jgi:hypothetical protein
VVLPPVDRVTLPYVAAVGPWDELAGESPGELGSLIGVGWSVTRVDGCI